MTNTLARWIAMLLPHKVSYWRYIIAGTKNIRRDEIVPEVTYLEILCRLTK